ncbi:Cof-type HAD-IIB family hydrolase [Caviibacter abscessus]|uniref:Cof-type HAD-IIB family hydrolase n=1 Tax=Caviibacter abscessus TaxID=1766719 RepID=UPI00082A5827|nr:Cof-type HAD-IIB family hydrolase [Caviibacter abscessus]
MFRAVITDLDGTLLNKDHLLTEFTKDTIDKLLDKGIKVFVATGRIQKGARAIADQFKHKLPLITTNGSRVIDENNNELLSIFLKDEISKYLVDFDYKKYGSEIFINGYSGTNWFVVDDLYKNFYLTKRLDKKYRPTQIEIEEFKKYKYNKIYFIGEYEHLLKIREVLRKDIGEYANIAFVSKNSLEIYDKNATKGNAAKFLLEKYGISLDEAISFGDGLNDIEMLTMTKKGYIMGNALTELKEMLPNHEIIEDSDTDAVARKIIEVFNL